MAVQSHFAGLEFLARLGNNCTLMLGVAERKAVLWPYEEPGKYCRSGDLDCAYRL